MAAGASGNGISIDSGVGGANGYSVGSFTHSNGIPMNASRLRRESMAHRDLASSLTNKMSWGGKSVESWVMDEYVCPSIHLLSLRHYAFPVTLGYTKLV